MSQEQPAPRRRGPLPGTPRGTRMSRSDRERQLIDIAEQVFGEHGYQVTTVDDIATRAGVTKPVIYDHFGSKEGLLAAVVTRMKAEITATLEQAWDALGENSSMEDFMRAGARAFFTYIDGKGSSFRLYQNEKAVVATAGAEIEDLRQAQAELMADRFTFLPVVAEMPREIRVASAELVVAVIEQLAVIRGRQPQVSIDFAVEMFVRFAWFGFRGTLNELADATGMPRVN